MGFGLLFLGFLTLLSFKILPVGVFGTAIMYIGVSKLCRHAPYFKKAKIMCGVFFGYFAIFTIVWLTFMMGFTDAFSESVKNLIWHIDELIYSLVFFAFSYVLMNALREICRQVGYEKGVNKYRLCSALFNVFGIGAAARFVMYFTSLSGAVGAPLYLVEILCIVTLSAWIYSCYMMIATQEIIDDENAKIAKYDQKHSNKHKK